MSAQLGLKELFHYGQNQSVYNVSRLKGVCYIYSAKGGMLDKKPCFIWQPLGHYFNFGLCFDVYGRVSGAPQG